MNSEAKHLISQNDPILKNIISFVPEPTIITTNDVFHDLLSCIIEQQIHYRSTKNIFGKALERSSLTAVSLDNFHELEENGIAAIKLSATKYETLLATVEYFSVNEVNWLILSNEEVVERLSSIKGIGKWTIDMILLYTLQRPNVFPYDDFHLKQIMVSEYNLNEKVKLKAQMLDISQKWGEYKSIAVLYLLEYKNYLKSVK